MAQSTKTAKPRFVNTNLEIAGGPEIRDQINNLRDAAEATNDLAMTALSTGDRKGVLLQMKTGGIYTRAANALEKALQRARTVRLTREEKKAYEADGTLPAGYEVVTLADDDDDDAEGDE